MSGWDDPATSLTGPVKDLDGELLGRGGEGVVVSGRDRRLPREVAWKVVAADDPAGAERLQREAEILARLDHPAIVPVYDLVRSDDGTLRLALRQIRGQTLRQAIVARSPAQRFGLLPHVLTAAHAVAWAHGANILHRDLNAANVMIGRFGETQVIDWGLACELSASRPELVGTPRTMSPEQARGEAATPRSDVWGLGTLLYEVLTGTPLHPELDDTERLLASRRVDPLPPITATAPPALIAIAERALAHDPEARYPDAEAFAADLATFLEGGLVAAHRYSAGELFLRFVRTFRVPLGLTLVALVVGSVAAVIAYLRIAEERDQTAAARDQTRAALVEADLVNARSALEDDHRAEAELAAARVLSMIEHPEARGILAALGRGPSPRLTSRTPITSEACLGADLSPSGELLACHGDDTLTVYGRDGRVHRRWSTLPRGVRFLDDQHLALSHPLGLHLFDLRGDGPTRRSRGCGGELVGGPAGLVDSVTECVTRVSPQPPFSIHPPVRPCDGGPVQSSAPLVDGLATLCPDGRLIIARDGSPPRVLSTHLASPIGNHRVFAELPGEDAIILGTARGDLMRLSLRDATIEAHVQVRPDRLVRWIDPRPPLVLVHIDGNLPVVYDARSLAEVARFPLTERRAWWLDGPEPPRGAHPPPGSRTPMATSAESGAPLQIATLASTPTAVLSTWTLPAPSALEPHRLEGRPGITSATFFGEGLLGLTFTDSAEILDTQGRVLEHATWHGLLGGVAKMMAQDGPGAIVALTSPSLPTVPDGHAPLRGVGHYRRIARLGGDGPPRFVLAPTGGGLYLLTGSERLPLLVDRQQDLDVQGSLLATVGTDPRELRLFDLAASPEPLMRCRTPDTVTLALIGPSALDPVATILVSEPTGALVLSHDCRPLLALASRAEPTIVAATASHPSGPLFALGTRDGTLEIYDARGHTRASLPAHSIAVRALEFSPSAELLVSGAWDGRLRLIATDRIFAPREDLVAEIHSAWLGTRSAIEPR